MTTGCTLAISRALAAAQEWARRDNDVIDTARVLDAGGNRAREALRVVEDYCRFVLDDAVLSGELKQLRHDLTQFLRAADESSGFAGLVSRETLRDVGTTISTSQEG